jgi:uncharacterized spore protein YtfJ
MLEEGEFGIPKEELTSGAQAVDAVQQTLELFFETADVGRVYGEPVQHGETIIIPAAEVLTGVGFGLGYGAGSAQGEGAPSGAPEGQGMESGPERGSGSGSGGGGGGGGRTLSRPVAVIVASPDGVQVQPVVDPTKIALAALTAFGFMAGMLMRMRRAANTLELE